MTKFLERSPLFLYMLIVVLLMGCVVEKQNPRFVSINNLKFSERFELLNQKKEIKKYDNAFYAWYKTNSIHYTQGAYDGILLNGLYTSFYLNNDLKETGKFVYGLKNGKWIKWYEKGIISETAEWKDGKLNGKLTKFDINSVVLFEENYRKGLLHGSRIEYSDGKRSILKKYRNGKELIPIPPRKTKEKIDKKISVPIEKQKSPINPSKNKIKKNKSQNLSKENLNAK